MDYNHNNQDNDSSASSTASYSSSNNSDHDDDDKDNHNNHNDPSILLKQYLIHRPISADFVTDSNQFQTNQNDNNEDEDEFFSPPTKTSLISSSWKTRESIHSLLQHRTQLLQKLNIHVENHHSNSYRQQHPSSNKFHIDKYLNEIQNDENDVMTYNMIQRTFSIAAMSVVQGLKQQLKDMKDYQDEMEEEAASGGKGKGKGLSTSGKGKGKGGGGCGDIVPPLLRVLDKVDQVKLKCFDTALNHDTIVKSITSSTSSSTTSRKRKSLSSSSSSSTATATTSTPNLKKIKKEDVTTSTISASKSKTDTTNNTTSTSAGTSDNQSSSFTSTNTGILNNSIDSRLTTSRAILCTAASIVFKELTPKYKNYGNGFDNDNDDDDDDDDDDYYNNNISNINNSGGVSGSTTKKNENDDENDINILDVPQNTHDRPKKTLGDDKNNSIDADESDGERTDTDISNNDMEEGEGNNNDDNKNNNNNKKNDNLSSSANNTTMKTSNKPIINMGAVAMSAEIFAQRSIEQILSSVKKGEQRRKWRMDCAKRTLVQRQYELSRSSYGFITETSTTTASLGEKIGGNTNGNGSILEKYLAWKDYSTTSTFDNANCVTEGSSDDDTEDDDDHNDDFEKDYVLDRRRLESEQQLESVEWKNKCLPRMKDIMNVGPGHVIMHDLQWKTRFHRVLDMLNTLATCRESDHSFTTKTKKVVFNEPNYGLHLIITTQSDYGKFMDALAPLDYAVNNDSPFYLRSLGYAGNDKKRRRLRIEHFTPIGLSGQKDAPYNVLVTTYTTFIKDYLHFCQIPFQAVILDDGMSWLGTANYDPNGKLGKVFDKGIWNQSDNHAGLAGVGYNKWDFSADANTLLKAEDETGQKKHTLVGLTARHRIIIASSLHSKYRGVTYSSPVPGLLSFFFPQFTDVVKEEWDRSRIQSCSESIEHLRKLLCRNIVVFTGCNPSQNMYSLALSSMIGKLHLHISSSNNMQITFSSSDTESLDDKGVHVSTDSMISHGKIVQSRRFAASWLRQGSAIRYELGTTSLDPITNVIKAKTSTGYVCEEIVTASSLTPSGSGGVISGQAAFKTAVRCGRTFASEQGLRQHIAALHAPPGTWLCRSCGSDCGTSQARTHHERSCGTNNTLGKTMSHCQIELFFFHQNFSFLNEMQFNSKFNVTRYDKRKSSGGSDPNGWSNLKKEEVGIGDWKRSQ